MRKKGWAMWLSAALVLINLTCANYSLAENEGKLHLYQGIPLMLYYYPDIMPLADPIAQFQPSQGN